MHWKTLDPNTDPDRLSYPTISITLEHTILASPCDASGSSRPASKSFYRINTLNLVLGPGSDQDGTSSQDSSLLTRSQIKHFECVDWSDRGTPEEVEPLLELIQEAEASAQENVQAPGQSPAPVLVHCSAGVGRTGTLIAIASCMRRLQFLRHSSAGFETCSTTDRGAILSSVSPSPLLGVRLPRLPAHLEQDLVARTVDHLREHRVSSDACL